jgi:uncharacterized protein
MLALLRYRAGIASALGAIVTIRLRPHHLLCMLTFAGKGYSPDFIANFDRITAQIASGNQTIELTFAPDDICAPLLADASYHCRNTSISERDSLAAEALTELLQEPVQPGTSLTLTTSTLDRMRHAFHSGSIRKACHGCQWSPLCDSIAANNFIDTHLLAGRPQRS